MEQCINFIITFRGPKLSKKREDKALIVIYNKSLITLKPVSHHLPTKKFKSLLLQPPCPLLFIEVAKYPMTFVFNIFGHNLGFKTKI